MSTRDSSWKQWAEKNTESDAHSSELRKLACSRLEAAERKIAERKGKAQETGADVAQVTTGAEAAKEARPAAAAPTTGGATTNVAAVPVPVPKWYQQKTHYVSVEPKDLANVQTVDWDNIDMEELHRGLETTQRGVMEIRDEFQSLEKRFEAKLEKFAKELEDKTQQSRDGRC